VVGRRWPNAFVAMTKAADGRMARLAATIEALERSRLDRKKPVILGGALQSQYIRDPRETMLSCGNCFNEI
jgi:hypothetical protein